MILEERVSDIFRNTGHGQNVVLTFFVPLGTDTIVEDEAIVFDQHEVLGGN